MVNSTAAPVRVAVSPLDGLILEIRAQRVLLDSDLARLYGVQTKALNRAVFRNRERFPPDFLLELTAEEWEILRRQIGTPSAGWGGRRHPPCAFTEQGVAMLSSVLRSPQAVKVNVEIMRAFVRLRRYAATNTELARKLEDEDLEKRVGSHDQAIGQVLDAIRRLMALPPSAPAKKIGFRPPGNSGTGARTRSRRG